MMKSALWLTLIVSLVASALPVTAQEKTETPGLLDRRGAASHATAGPVARAITREAVRLAAAGEPTPSGVEAVQQGDKPAESNWSRVLKLAPGTEVIVTVQGSQPGTRYVVLADESDLTVLSLTDPALPTAATRVLLDMASHHPEYFAAAQKAGAFVDKSVRVAPDGVFVADRKVADLGQIVERIARTDVVEIRSPGRSRGSVAGAIIGAGGGFLLGRVLAVRLAYKQCGGSCSDETALIGLALVGLPIAGGVLGYHAFRHKTNGVIYRAP